MKYYWFDRNLICGEYDDAGNKDRDTEEIIVRDIYNRVSVNLKPETIAEQDMAWAKIDAYIEQELGFLPDYEI